MPLLMFVMPSFAVDASMWAELAKVSHLQARFTQTQTRKVLKQPLTSTGALDFQRPSSLTWTVDPPYASTFSLQGTRATMAYPALKINQSVDLASTPDANRLATSLLVWLQADAAVVERQFTVSYGTSTATLVPKDATLRSLLDHIELSVATGPTRVRSVLLAEPDGDQTRIDFSSVVADGAALPDAR